MKKGTILVDNCFNDADNYYLLACRILSGEVNIGDSIIVNEMRITIHNIEIPFQNTPTSIILSISKEGKYPIRIHEMCNNTYGIG